MSSFNSFLGGMEAGQDVQQNRQNAFNASMMPRDEAAIQPPATRQDSGGGSTQNLVQLFAGLDTAQRQRVRAELTRKGQIVDALSSLPVDQQAIGIQTYGKDFGIEAVELQRAAADPVKALASFESSLRGAETLLEQASSEMRPDITWGKALAYENPRASGSTETPATLLAQAAEGRGGALKEYNEKARNDENRTSLTEETKTAGHYGADGGPAPHLVNTAHNPEAVPDTAPETLLGAKAVSKGRETVHLGEDIAPLQLGEILKILKLDGTKFIRTAEIEGDGTFAFIDTPLDVLPSIFEEPPLFTSRYLDDNNVERAILAVTPDGGIGAVPFSRNLSIDGSEGVLLGNILPSRNRDMGLTGLTAIAELGVSGGGANVISRGKLKAEGSELPLKPGSRRPGARFSYDRGVPSGFPSHEAFKDYGKVFKDGLSKLGYPNATPILRGSSVSGSSYKKGTSFYKGDESDFDLAIIDEALFNKLQKLGTRLSGRNTRTVPLKPKIAEQVGLMPLQEELKKIAGGRKTSFVVYKNVEALVARQQPFRKFPR